MTVDVEKIDLPVAGAKPDLSAQLGNTEARLVLRFLSGNQGTDRYRKVDITVVKPVVGKLLPLPKVDYNTVFSVKNTAQFPTAQTALPGQTRAAV